MSDDFRSNAFESPVTTSGVRPMRVLAIFEEERNAAQNNPQIDPEEYAHLIQYRLIFDRAERRAGQCQYGPKLISLSRYYIARASEEQVRDTIRHEMAHAMTPGHGHDATWKSAARRMGGSDSRTYDSATLTGPARVPLWHGTTAGQCDCQFRAHRLTTRMKHGRCSQHMHPVVWRKTR